MNERELRALEIAAKTKIKRNGKKWLVSSQTGDGTQYTVDLNPDESCCTCLDHETHRIKCKHIYAVEYTIEREQTVTRTTSGDTTTTTVTETVKLRYKQVWAAYNSAQTNEKARFLELLQALCSNVDEPIQTMGRTRHPMSDMLFATVYKVYAAVSSRRFMTDLKDAYARAISQSCLRSIQSRSISTSRRLPLKCQDIGNTGKCHDIGYTFSSRQFARGYERSP